MTRRRIELEAARIPRHEETPYRRAGGRLALCDLCGHEADYCCPRCGRPLCVAHSLRADRRCASCELQFSARRSWIDWVGFGVGVSIFGGLIAVLGYETLPVYGLSGAVVFLGVLAFVAAGVVGGVLWAVLHGIARRRFLSEGDGEMVIAERLQIAPRGGSAAERRKVGMGYTVGNRGLPSVPLYQRTYGH